MTRLTMTVPSVGWGYDGTRVARRARHEGEGETRRGGLCDGAQDAGGSRAALTRSAGPEDGEAGRRGVESAAQWRHVCAGCDSRHRTCGGIGRPTAPSCRSEWPPDLAMTGHRRNGSEFRIWHGFRDFCGVDLG